MQYLLNDLLVTADLELYLVYESEPVIKKK